MNKKQPLIAILGPTASGKTALGIGLAQKLHTEILSGDSMLVYRNFNIGTAKPSKEEQAGIVHHLIDILEPMEEFNVTRFKDIAKQTIHLLSGQDKIPLLVGGTGLYARSLLEDYQFNDTSRDTAYREGLEQLAQEKGKEHVHAMLSEVDPETASRLHINDFRRVIRALEVWHTGKEKISQVKNDPSDLAYNALVIGLTMERWLLYERINQRVDLMMQAGLEQEVRGLLAAGIPVDCQAMKGIGYKEMVSYITEKSSLAEAVDEIKKATRHFAKRQITWFKRMPYIKWYRVDLDPMECIVEKVYKEAAGKYLIE